jgi:transcriptional regulator with XRE-family HTH domain
MRWDYGSIYKKIRTEKGLSQKDICGSTLSRTTLSKLENNKLAPSHTTMLFLLDQISMTIEEFDYVCNDFMYSDRIEIINSFFTMASNFDYNELTILKEKSQKYLKKNDDIYIVDLVNIIESLIILSVDSTDKIDCLPKIFVNKIWGKISKMDVWYYNEIRLINCCMFYFPIETVLAFLPKLISTINKYEKYKPMSTVKMSILLNGCLLLIQHSYKDKAAVLAKEAIDIAKKEKRFDYLSIAKVRYGICLNDATYIESGFAILEVCGEDEIVFHLRKEVDTFLDSNNTINFFNTDKIKASEK